MTYLSKFLRYRYFWFVDNGTHRGPKYKIRKWILSKEGVLSEKITSDLRTWKNYMWAQEHKNKNGH